MANEIEVATISALAERLRAFETRIGQIAKVDDVRVAEHRAGFHQSPITEDVMIEALVALEVETIRFLGHSPFLASAIMPSE